MQRLHRRWRVAGLLVAVLLVTMVLGAMPGVSAAAEPLECRNVRFGVVGFSDVAAVTAITSEVLTRLGYAPASVNLPVPIIFASLQNRNIDVFLGNWMPAQEADSKPYLANRSVEVVGPNLEKAKFTLAVPQYLYDAGLQDFASIQKFAGPLDSAIYGIEPGAAANRLVLGMIRTNAFGLGHFRLIESSEQGMLAELERAYRTHKPFVFVAWDPHPMNLRFQIQYLAGGDTTFGPDFGGATINTVTRSGLTRQCPNLGRLLHNLKFTLRGESEIMAAMLDRHEQPDVAAKEWLGSHADLVGSWLVGVSSFDGRPPQWTQSAAAAAQNTGASAGTDRAANPLERWMLAHKIPLGDATAGALEYLKTRGSSLFDGIALVGRGLVDGVTLALRAIPALGFIVGAGFLAWIVKRSWPLALFVSLALLFMLNQGYWTPMLETLSLVLVATLASVAIGIPVGIAGAHHPRFYATLRPVLDLMQTLPTFVYLIPTLVLFGLGPVPGLISTVIFAMPAPIRLTQAGISGVPAALKEVAHAFGATRFQLLWKVELPGAAPLIRAGITQCIMLSLSMVVVAALVGAGGLGVPVVRALNSVQVGPGFDAGLVIVLLAVLLDRIFRPR
jgi:glycine betaine/proline transport system substrate-binding protein